MQDAVGNDKIGENYSAYVADLAGCLAAAKTMEKIKGEIEEAIEFPIEGPKEDGLPAPVPLAYVDA